MFPPPPPPPPTDPIPVPTIDPTEQMNNVPDLPAYSGNFRIETEPGTPDVPVIVYQSDPEPEVGITDSSGVFVPTTPNGIDPVTIMIVGEGAGVELVQFFADPPGTGSWSGYTRIGYPPAEGPGKFKPAKGFIYSGTKINYNFTVKSARDGTVISGAQVDFYWNKSTGDADGQALSDPSGVVQGFKYSGIKAPGTPVTVTYVTVQVIAPGYKGCRITVDVTPALDTTKIPLKTIWLQ